LSNNPLIPPVLTWPVETITQSLHEEDVLIWAAPLLQPAAIVSRLTGLLSAAEQARATRFKVEAAYRQFSIGRGLLRLVLGQYLATDPARLEFEYGPRQKPALAGAPLQFNLAHSGEVALIAVTPRQPVGIDVEAVRPMKDMLSIAKRFFAPAEYRTLRQLPPAMQTAAFYHGWTRKEAYLKALGDGLARPLDQFEVSLAPGQPAAILTIGGETLPAQEWSLTALEPGPGYIGALAVRGQGYRVSCRQLILPP
jgi:4'-phosphopantetheinyl transferase